MYGAAGNGFAYAIILVWMVVVPLLYKYLRPTTATCWAIVGAALILPERVEHDLPLVPPLSKRSVPYYMTFLVLFFKFRRRLVAAKPFRGVDRLVLLLIAGNIGTALTNTDPTGWGNAGDRGLTLYDALVLSIRDLVMVYAPFLIGRIMFRDARDLRELMRFIVGACIIYSLPAIFETRMNPVLHKWVYGFRPFDFLQAMRMGAWRPSVFFDHGLVLGRFMLVGAICAAALYKARQRIWRIPPFLVVIFTMVVLILCRSTGAIMLGLMGVPLVLFFKAKGQMRFAFALAVMVIAYPALRATGLFPVESLVNFGYWVDHDRGSSLEDRFEQEELLTDKVVTRPVFGWGEYSRSHVFDERSGRDITIVDGEWLLVFSERGLVGFVGWFALYLWPVWLTWRSYRQLPAGKSRVLIVGMCLAVSVMLVDMLLNSTGTMPQFFLVGVLTGTIQGAVRKARAERRAAAKAAAEAKRQQQGGGHELVAVPQAGTR